MNRKICSYNYQPVYEVVKLESVKDSMGNIFHRVTCYNGDKENEFYLFENLSSAIDFVKSNFR